MKKRILGIVLGLMLCVSPVFASKDSQWGVGARLGSVSGLTMQYKMDKFDVIGACNYGFLFGGWAGVEGGVNFHIMSFDWTDGDWDWTIGAVGNLGYHFGDDDGFYFGAFAPFRLNYTFPSAPWSFFVELAPGVDIVPKVRFDMEAGIGATYLF